MTTALLILALVLTLAAFVGSCCWLAGQGFFAWICQFDPMVKGFAYIVIAIASVMNE